MAWVSRVRRRLRVLLVLVFLIGVAAAAVAGLRSDREVAPDDGLSLSCLPFTEPRTVEGLNRMIARYRAVPGFVGADVGADVQLQDGRRLWVFGDTLRQRAFHGDRIVRNSMLMFSPGCATVVMPRDHGAVVPDRDDGVGYWPMDLGVVHQVGYDVVGVSLQRVRSTGSGAFDFETLGPALALFTVPVHGVPRLISVRDIGPDDPDPTRPTWGAAIETAPGAVYIYGTALPPGGHSFGRLLEVARAPITDVENQAAWRYWDGHRWQRHADRAAVLIPAAGGVSQVLSVFERGGSWYAVSKRDDFLGHDLIIWKAPAPTGPFVPSAPLAELPSDSADGLLRYMPLAHPDLLPEAGTVVVSYSRNVADLQRLLKDPSLYRPRFLRVRLP